MDRIEQFRCWQQEQTKKPYALSITDCTMTLADWAVFNGYADPVADYRGAYHVDTDMYGHIERFGDLVGLVSHFCELAGLEEINRPETGAIAVIGAPRNVYRQWGAIWDGARWQVRLETGFTSLSARALKIWRV